MARRIERRTEPLIRKCADVRDHACVDCGDGDKQGDEVEPTDPPAISSVHGELRVLIKGPRHGVRAAEFTEHLGNEEHPNHRDHHQPDVTRAAATSAQSKQ